MRFCKGLLALLETFRPLHSDEASLSSRAGLAARTAAGAESRVGGGGGGLGAEGIVSAENSVGVSRETLHWRYGTAFGFETRENRRGRGREMLVLSTPANIFEKVALSHGMQRSVKIDRIEYFMDQLVNSLRALPRTISVGISKEWGKGYLSMLALGHGDEAHKEALKKMGEILRLRDIVNLRGSLETPDVYWDLPELEGMYELISGEFELSRRVSLLNLKLDYTQELVEARRIQLKDRRSTMLTNWIIGNSFSKVLYVMTLYKGKTRGQ